MKQLSARFLHFISLALVACVATGCKTNSATEFPQTYKVAGIVGDARYFEEKSDVPHALKFGDSILPGTVIQTASGAWNEVMLVPDEQVIPKTPNNPRPYDYSDKVILHENSVLKIDRHTARTVKGEKIKDTRLNLLAGSVLCDIGFAWPTDEGETIKFGPPGPRLESIKPRPNASYFEIRSSDIVVHAEHGVFFFSCSGIIRVVQGAVALELPSRGVTKDLFSGQENDLATGEISQIEIPSHRLDEWPDAFWGWLRPRVALPPAYQVPQRPF